MRKWLAKLITKPEREELHRERKTLRLERDGLNLLHASLNARNEKLIRKQQEALPPIQPPARPTWTEIDQSQLQGFLQSNTGKKLIVMLQGAQYKNLLAGAKSGNDRVSLGIGEAINCIWGLASGCDPVAQPEKKLTPEEELFESWKP